MRIEELLSILDCCNNGYLFAPSAEELECAKQNTAHVTISGGLIYRNGRLSERFAPLMPSPVTLVSRHYLGDFDYEGAILSAQENSGIFD